jgi:hypothetical protein
MTKISKKISSFILFTKTYLGFLMDVHPGDDGSFPDADPSNTEDDCGDKQTAAEMYINNKDKMFSF